jgi:hypothetical protein
MFFLCITTLVMEVIKMVDFGTAIKKPFGDVKTLAIGSVIGLIPIVSLLVNGYGFKIAEKTMKGKNDLIEWSLDDLTEYVIKAIMGIIISLGYAIIPLIILAIGIGPIVSSFLTEIISGGNDFSMVGNALMTSGPIIGLGAILLLVALFITPMALMKWVKKGELSAAFKIGDVVKNTLTGDYIIAWIFLIVYGMILGIIVGILGLLLAIIPVIGWILLLLINGAISFIMTVTTMSIFSQTVK